MPTFRLLSFCRPLGGLLLWLLATSRLLAQPTVLTGFGFTDLTGEPVRTLRPVPGGYLNYFATGIAPVGTITQGQFQVAFVPQAAGELVSVQAKTFPQLYAFIEPGGAPVVLRHSGGGAVTAQSLVFEGPNAAGNNLLLRGRLLNRPAGVDQERVRKLLAPATTPAAALRGLRSELRTCLTQLDSVRSRRLISAACYATLRAGTEQQLLFWTMNLVLAYQVEANRSRLDFHLSEADLRQVVASLEQELDPFAPRYRGLFVTVNTTSQKCRLLAMGWLPGPAPTPYWQQYATSFKDIYGSFGDVDYAPPAIQRLYLGDALLTALAFKPMSDAEFAAVCSDYARHFPTSPYVPILLQALLQERAVPTVVASNGPVVVNPNQTLGRYEATTGQLAFAPLAGLDTVTTLPSLLRRQFAGRPVFVDFWATWCAPCLAEFTQEPALHAFLEQQGIEPLYVSVNAPNFRAKWRDFVGQYKLRGSHYLASPAVQKSLEPLLARGIPRYLLFDAQGHLVDNDLPFPSTGEVLRQRIRQKLAGK
jgi:thiol-disulfide isomerase/thioredoxin